MIFSGAVEGGGATAHPKFLPDKIFVKNALTGREFSVFHPQFQKPGWTEQSKVVSELILKCNFFMQPDVLHE